jgi:hypothetical protein
VVQFGLTGGVSVDFPMKEKQVMGLTGDRYEGKFRGHAVELVRNEWTKVLKLLIDGNVVARKFCPFPGSVTLTATIDEGKRKYEVVVKSVIRFPFYQDTIEVDGRLLELTKTK